MAARAFQFCRPFVARSTSSGSGPAPSRRVALASLVAVSLVCTTIRYRCEFSHVVITCLQQRYNSPPNLDAGKFPKLWQKILRIAVET